MRFKRVKMHKIIPLLKFKVWGGKKLLKIKEKQFDYKLEHQQLPLGETWEVSLHEAGISLTEDKVKLNKIYSIEDIPYIIKFIDTSENLSIQVHPTLAYAEKNNIKSKSECWLILSCEEGAGVFLGLKEGVTKEKFGYELSKKSDMSELLNFYPVKKGEFFFIPAGTIHSIGKDILLIEIQQASDITYRVWDWNRENLGEKKRDLHIKEALEVINFSREKNEKGRYFHRENCLEGKTFELFKHRDFNINIIILKKDEIFRLVENVRAISLVVLAGTVLCEEIEVKKFFTIVIEKNKGILLEAITNLILMSVY